LVISDVILQYQICRGHYVKYVSSLWELMNELISPIVNEYDKIGIVINYNLLSQSVLNCDLLKNDEIEMSHLYHIVF